MMKVVNRWRKKMLGNEIITSAQRHQRNDVPNSTRTGKTAAESAIALQQFSRWRPSAILNLKKHRILTADGSKRSTLQYSTKFGADLPRRCGDIVIFV